MSYTAPYLPPRSTVVVVEETNSKASSFCKKLSDIDEATGRAITEMQSDPHLDTYVQAVIQDRDIPQCQTVGLSETAVRLIRGQRQRGWEAYLDSCGLK